MYEILYLVGFFLHLEIPMSDLNSSPRITQHVPEEESDIHAIQSSISTCKKKSTYANPRLDSPIRWALPLIRPLQGVPPVATVVYFWSSLVQAAPGHIGADQHIIRLNEEENWCNVILRIHHCAPLNG